MVQTNRTLITSVIIATSLLAACGGSSSKSSVTTDKGVNAPTNSFKTVACKSMLPPANIALLTEGSSCGYLTVPEKHALYGQAASEINIEIAVIKLASTSKNKQADPVVYLQGGPGGSASSSIAQVIETASFIDNRDVYLIDQRGTGYSKPALLCTEFDLSLIHI